MLKRITVNLEEIESMLYFWHSTKDREKVSEVYLSELGAMPGLSRAYCKEFDQESVRKVLSAITNRERLSSMTKYEGRFWNNNMWMMEDLGYTDAMARPVKKLNLDELVGIINQETGDCSYEEIEVRFSPLSTDDYLIDGNRLIINFFRIKPDADDAGLGYIDEKGLRQYIKEKLTELVLNKK